MMIINAPARHMHATQYQYKMADTVAIHTCQKVVMNLLIVVGVSLTEIHKCITRAYDATDVSSDTGAIVL